MPNQDKSKGSVTRVFSLVAILTVLSKVAGLARDIILLQAFGTSVIADAYNIAYSYTGNVLVLFGGLGGPFHSASVAILTPKKEQKDTGLLIVQMMLITVSFLALLALLAYFLAPQIIPMLSPAPGHSAAYRADLWKEITGQLYVMLPIIMIAGIVGVSYGVLNVYGQFFWPSISPAAMSLSLIVAVGFFASSAGGMSLALGTLIGATIQMLLQLPGVFKIGTQWGISTKPQPGLFDYTTMLWPAAISTSIGQLNVYIDIFFTSRLPEGAYTAILNANRLVQLPLGVLITAMLVPMLPRFTEHVAKKRTEELKGDLRQSVSFLWFLALPMAALLLSIPGPIIMLLFERGHFNETSRALVTAALLFLVPGIFFYVARDLVTRVFYAHQDSATPYYVAIFVMVAHFIFDWVLVGPLGVGGIALATTLATVVNLTTLSILLRRKIGSLGIGKLLGPTSIMLFSSAICGGVTYFLQSLIFNNATAFHLGKWLSLFFSISVSCSIGLGLYFAICLLCKLDEPHALIRRLKKKANKT